MYPFTDAGKADEVNVNSSDGVESVASGKIESLEVIDKTDGWVAASIGVRTNRDVLHNIETFKLIKWNLMGEVT